MPKINSCKWRPHPFRLAAGKLDMTQADVAEAAGVSTTTVGKLFRGEGPVSERKAAAVCRALGLELEGVVDERLAAAS